MDYLVGFRRSKFHLPFQQRFIGFHSLTVQRSLQRLLSILLTIDPLLTEG